MSHERLLEKRGVGSELELVQENLRDLGLTLDDLAGKKVLDVGAGHALIGKLAKERGIDVVSVDRNPAMWTDGQKSEIPDVPYIQADAENLPFPDGQFDLVIDRAGPLDVDSIGFRKNATVLIQEVMRTLKPGGELRFGPAQGTPEALQMLKRIDPNVQMLDSGRNGKFTKYYVLHRS
jgi:ubiquinone/menaquinone biosynthesis C-methylase UbiE